MTEPSRHAHPSADPERASVLLVGLDLRNAEALEKELRSSAEVRHAAGPEEGLELLRAGGVAVLATGGSLGGGEASLFLEEALRTAPMSGVLVVVLSAGDAPEVFQEHLDRDLLFYLSKEMPGLAETRLVLRGALGTHSAQRAESGVDPTRVIDQTGPLLGVASLSDLSEAMRDVVRALISCDHALCLLHDLERDVLWAPADSERAALEASAASGLTSYSLRTGTPVRVENASEDVRYDPDADSLGREWGGPVLIVPVVPPGVSPRSEPNRGAMAILVALGRPGSLFTAEDEKVLELLAAQAAPLLLKLTLESLVERRQVARGHDALYRSEALDHHAGATAGGGRTLEISPRGTRLIMSLLAPALLLALLVVTLGRVGEYASGPAIVQLAALEEVVASSSGTVEEVLVSEDSAVIKQSSLIRLDRSSELAEVVRLTREFEVHLVARLREPHKSASALAVAGAQARLHLATARLDERTVRSQADGLVREVLVEGGSLIQPGQVVAVIETEEAERSAPGEILALFPGHTRPLIKPGMKLRFRLRGHKEAEQDLTVDAISDGLIGPAEASRLLGQRRGDTVPLSGPAVLVRARLSSNTFRSAGEDHFIHDGMLGDAEIPVRRESILSRLLPDLREIDVVR